MVISYANTACGTLPKLASSRQRGLLFLGIIPIFDAEAPVVLTIR